MHFDSNTCVAVVGLVKAAVARQQGKRLGKNLGSGLQQHATVVQALLYIVFCPPWSYKRKDKTVTLEKKKKLYIYLVKSPRLGSTPRHTD
jgi:hypothetical protein